VARAWGLARFIVDETDFDEERLKSDHIWLLGRGDLLDRLAGPESAAAKNEQVAVGSGSAAVAGTDFALSGNTLICTIRNPEREELGIGIVVSGDVGALESLARRIPHYSKYSYLGFQGSRPTLRGVWPERESPLAVDFRER
jgi:hypothetical protein